MADTMRHEGAPADTKTISDLHNLGNGTETAEVVGQIPVPTEEGTAQALDSPALDGTTGVAQDLAPTEPIEPAEAPSASKPHRRGLLWGGGAAVLALAVSAASFAYGKNSSSEPQGPPRLTPITAAAPPDPTSQDTMPVPHTYDTSAKRYEAIPVPDTPELATGPLDAEAIAKIYRNLGVAERNNDPAALKFVVADQDSPAAAMWQADIAKNNEFWAKYPNERDSFRVIGNTQGAVDQTSNSAIVRTIVTSHTLDVPIIVDFKDTYGQRTVSYDDPVTNQTTTAVIWVLLNHEKLQDIQRP